MKIAGYFQVSLFATGERPQRPPRPRPAHKRVWASLTSDKDTFIADVKAEMRRRDPRRRRTWVIVTDGERALQHRVTDSFKDTTLVLDLLHALEKPWKAAHALHREGSPEAQAFVYQRAKRILEGQVDQVVKGLKLIITKRKLTGNKAKTLLDVAGYYHRNRERMRYDTYLANGCPIASGSVEGACKNLIRDRFERSGMRWTQETAEALLRLRALHLSGDFDAYWDYHANKTSSAYTPRGKSSRSSHTLVIWLTQIDPTLDSFAAVTREHALGFLTALAEDPNPRTGRPLGALSRIGRASALSMFFRDTAAWQWPDVPGHPLLGAGDRPKRRVACRGSSPRTNSSD